MSLTIMSRTLRALAYGYEVRAKMAEDEARGLLLSDMSLAHSLAAAKLDEESRTEAMEFAKAHECTVDHAKMTTSICPCCGARKGR